METLIVDGYSLLRILPALFIGIGIGLIWGSLKVFSKVKDRFSVERDKILEDEPDLDEQHKKWDLANKLRLDAYDEDQKQARNAMRWFVGAIVIVLIIAFGD